MTEQHRTGRHYTPNAILSRYNEFLLATDGVYDPFVGHGNMVKYYLNLFSLETAAKKLSSGKIKGADINPEAITSIISYLSAKYGVSEDVLSENFTCQDSLLTDDKTESFILTNPPYLAKNVVKRKFPDDYDKYFKASKACDYYEIALKKYGFRDGIWVIPSNFISSNSISETRRSIMTKHKVSDIVMYDRPMFEDTDISVVSFLVSSGTTAKDSKLEIGAKKISIDFTDGYTSCKKWVEATGFKPKKKRITHGFETVEAGKHKITILDVDKKDKDIQISTEQYKIVGGPSLILRAIDTGTKDGVIGLYNFHDIFPDSRGITMATKISSRAYIPIFVNIDKNELQRFKDAFNFEMAEYRELYDSIFLTNFKNVTKTMIRKRITFKEAIGLMEKIISDKF